jgi:hypothetical protein
MDKAKRVEREKMGLAVDGQMEGRRIMFIMSDELPDRSGDIVKLDGWDMAGFMKNPVFLSMHDTGRYPIGTWEKVWSEGGQLRGVARFAAEGTHPEADLAYSLYKQGIMNAVSVKFLGNEYEPNEHGGLTFTSQELLECSAVPVPMNANALAIARGYDTRTQGLFLKDSDDAGNSAGAPTEPDVENGNPEISAQSLGYILANLRNEEAQDA